MEKAEIIIDGIHTGYFACDNGDIIGKHGKILSKTPGTHGYANNYICYDDIQVRLLAHRVIWAAFNGAIPINMQINHIDGCKVNNTLINLEIVTPSDNIKHAYKHGLKKPVVQRGALNGNVKITEEKAIAVINALKEGKYTHKQIAERVGVTIWIVKDITYKKTWVYLPR